MIDLQKFCGTDVTRQYLHHPFRVGDQVIATNGHIMCCLNDAEMAVPDISEIGAPSQFSLSRVMTGPQSDVWVALQDIEIPQKVTCDVCEGSGQDIEDDLEECGWCWGRGFERRYIQVGSSTFDAAYLRLIAELPNASICASPNLKVSVFKFDGGEGRLMPVKV